MLKILQIAKYYHPYFGGMEKVYKDLVDGLNQDYPCQIKVLCSNDKNKYEQSYVGEAEIFRLARMGSVNSLPICPSTLTYIKKLIQWCDIIHLHSPNPLSELSLLLVNTNKPLFVTHHSDIVKQKITKYFYNPFYKLILKKAKKIFVPTINHIQYSDTLNDFKHKIKIIPFGLRSEPQRPDQDLKRKVQSKYGKFILFVGRIVEYKGLEYLIRSMKKSNLNLVIVGKGEIKKKLQKLVYELNLNHQVIFLGRVDDINFFDALFHSCEFFILPSISKNENFGMVQLEAMACSKPIITTRLTSGVPTVAEEDVSSLLVEPKNVEQLSLAIDRLENDSLLQIKMGKEARKRYERLYTYKDFIKNHYKNYR